MYTADSDNLEALRSQMVDLEFNYHGTDNRIDRTALETKIQELRLKINKLYNEQFY